MLTKWLSSFVIPRAAIQTQHPRRNTPHSAFRTPHSFHSSFVIPKIRPFSFGGSGAIL